MAIMNNFPSGGGNGLELITGQIWLVKLNSSASLYYTNEQGATVKISLRELAKDEGIAVQVPKGSLIVATGQEMLPGATGCSWIIDKVTDFVWQVNEDGFNIQLND